MFPQGTFLRIVEAHSKCWCSLPQLLEKHHEVEERQQRQEEQLQAMLEEKRSLLEAKERRQQELKAIQVPGLPWAALLCW
jgi:hypothetical protein